MIREAIESALSQTYPDVEVIVIDDGSTDGSLDVIRSFGNLVRWETGPNGGACSARNRGVGLAKGKLIQFLDADDLLHSDKLERQVPRSVALWPQIVCCRWISELHNSAAGHLYPPQQTYADPVVHALNGVGQTSALLYPKAVLDEIGGWRESLPCGQDYDLILRLACAEHTFYILEEPLVTLRRLAGSLSSDHVRVLDQFEEICWSAYRRLRADGALTEERAGAFAGAFARHARAYLRYGLIERANARFAEARKMHPSGGLHIAYGPRTRLLRRVAGPVATEALVGAKRRFLGQMWNGKTGNDRTTRQHYHPLL